MAIRKLLRRFSVSLQKVSHKGRGYDLVTELCPKLAFTRRGLALVPSFKSYIRH